MKKAILKLTAHTLILTLGFQLLFPVCAFALTSGPSQPEVQSFEPVGTTEMVDMFTGDFTYNIPLMDVEGYPVNIAYHAGVGMEQEASWCGLGWNINPGEINRTVRGLPDDFNGDIIEKQIHIKPEKDFRVGMGGGVSLEVAGFNTEYLGLSVGLTFGQYLNYNNYKGLSIGVTSGVSVSTPVASVGINMGIGSQTGADVDVNAGLTLPIKISAGEGGKVGMSATGGTGFNSRTGLKEFTYGGSVSITVNSDMEHKTKNEKGEETWSRVSATLPGANYGSSVPVGLQNYVAVVTNASTMTTLQFQMKFGGEIFYASPSLYFNVMKSDLEYNDSGSRKGYGYLYSENADDESTMDFSREKDGEYNRTLQNLPASSMTYDVYAVNGQGTGGQFRPFRNDIGTVHDPHTESQNGSKDLQLEFGLGNLFEVGTDINVYDDEIKSGPWQRIPFGGDAPGGLYEKVFFKQGGELTYNDQQSVPQLFNTSAQYLRSDMHSLAGNWVSGQLPAGYGSAKAASAYWNGSVIDRSARASLITYKTAAQASNTEVAQSRIISNRDSGGRFFDPVQDQYNRYTGAGIYRDHDDKPDHISEFVQTRPDGKRYVYGIPAMNHASSEHEFAINEGDANIVNGMVKMNSGDNSTGNSQGVDNFYSVSNTPAYAHSYLLTSVLSNDYVDVLGDGPTDDDLGSYTKFNYTLTDNDYRWRTPYHKTGQPDSAQYNPGFWSDRLDGKGSYIVGSRQQWHLRSIETKNYVAEFYISHRQDGLGVQESVLPATSKIQPPGLSLTSAKANGDSSFSYKIDSIKLYNKHDRYINEEAAVPVKTVVFQYDYSLCPGIPNTTGSGGKLTLKKLFIKYGKSEKNLLSPYVFTYSNTNPAYDFAAKDRWGCYKPNSAGLSNYEFPYVSQPQNAADSAQADQLASAWNLTNIKLPSGGNIKVEYESDDYAFVQDRRAMDMFHVVGFGSSKNLDYKSTLYESENDINDYVYFKRNKYAENSRLSIADNYLEGQTYLYYSFNLDITGKGRFEHIKGYAKIDEVGYCNNDPTSDYGYVKLKRDAAGGMMLNPATIYGLNMARHYLPHILYPGFKNGSDGSLGGILSGMLAAAGEMGSIWQNPFKRFLKESKGKNVVVAKSWIRLQAPGLIKKGGGMRVKTLKLDDNWQALSGNPDNASYGKQYDYTIYDSKYGRISSGVASYEPLVGGDENPFHLPVPYTADGGRLLPAEVFFQEEPFGESFFPSPNVGYSSVKVKSIHSSEGRSSQAMDEYTFYTARDYPTSVEHTQKEAPDAVKTHTLRRKYQEEHVLQGYALKFNDMHGKPKSVNNYVLHVDGSGSKDSLEKITGVSYHYKEDGYGKLSNTVKALVRDRGSNNSYGIHDITLGQDVDFTVDSRERYNRSYNRNVAMNLNVVMWTFIPVPIPTVFFPDKEDVQIFRTMVSTKIVQQYGILSSVENYDHGATTVTENMIYDAETGGVLLTKTNNDFNDPIYNLKYPAHLAYQGMRPAYLNTGFKNSADSLVIDTALNGWLYGVGTDKYTPGDEILVDVGGSKHKVWVTDINKKLLIRIDSMIYTQPARLVDTFFDQKVLISSNGDTTWFPWRHIHFGTQNGLGYEYYDTAYVNNPDSTPVCCWIGGARYDTTLYIPSSSYYVYDTTIQNTCIPKIQPRYKSAYYWPQAATKLLGVPAEIIRSGHRNNLDQYVQSVNWSAPAPISSTVDSLFNRPYNTIDMSASTFTDSAWRYLPYADSFNDALNATFYKGFNPYVLGTRGNFRPLAPYAPIASRSYTAGHTRFDGTYQLPAYFWYYDAAAATNACGDAGNVFNTTSAGGNALWKQVSGVTKYDVNGNALEERDAIGNYSSAQYGYNKVLPVAVATNARQQSFFFDGFEDYHMLIPATTAMMLNTSAAQFTPFANLITGLVNVSAYNHISAASNDYFSRYGQYYGLKDPAFTNPNGGSHLTLSTAASHTGFYSLYAIQASSLLINADSARSQAIQPFSITPGRHYLIDAWVKPSGTIADGLVEAFYESQHHPLKVKSSSMDGWYLMEADVDLTQLPPGQTFALTIQTGSYVDDIRMMPVDANMKSFVYDPFTFRLMAQLDENHMASLYEYDQEGLLVRVKKETSQGVMTISESRRANRKQP